MVTAAVTVAALLPWLGAGQMLATLADRFGRVRVMVAADVDDTVLRDGQPMAELPDVCDAVHVYFNESDNALRVSDATKANPERLGARGAARRRRRLEPLGEPLVEPRRGARRLEQHRQLEPGRGAHRGP